ncbi:hypothetical protein BASA82_000100 [Batrachochytrium salamandrivorans]|nr:hypothetical protein BASA82_000100 [Batrachochytrium salamandrivorans]
MKLAIAIGLLGLVSALEYVIITDPLVISPDDAIAQLAIPISTNLRTSSRGNYKRKQHKIARKVTASQRSFGLVAEDLDQDEQDALRLVPGVQHVVINEEIRLANEDYHYTSQWNLDRVDQAVGLDGSYFPANETGAGVDLYILDTGVYAQHEAFGGRVETGMSSTGNSPQEDCVGHGTHVASTAAGQGFGVATSATIIPVQILNCYKVGSLMSMADGVSWVLQQMKLRPKKRAVINASIESNANAGVDMLIRNLQVAGAVVVVAAANQNDNACNYSPAREPLAITVGATTPQDTKLASSNFGTCVDLFAPGATVVGAGTAGPTAQATLQGTSMASPLVAGVVATLWQRFPDYTNNDITRVLLENLATEIVLDCNDQTGNSRVKFLQTMPVAVSAGEYTSLAVGQKLRSDFLNWSPSRLTAQPNSQGEICVSFSAKIANVVSPSYGPLYSSFRLALSTQVLPNGIVSKPTCSSSLSSAASSGAAIKYYVVENGAMYSKISSESLFEMAIATHDNAPAQQMFTEYAEDFYLTVKPNANGGNVSIEFGKGIGQDERTRFPLVFASDVNTIVANPHALQFLSFSSPNMYNIEFGNVRNCNPPIMGDSTSPSTDISGGAGILVPTLPVLDEQRREYFLWPQAWQKPSLNLYNCLAFAIEDFDNLVGRIAIAMAAKPLGIVPVGGLVDDGNITYSNKDGNDNDVYEFQLSKTQTILLHNGVVVHSATNKNKINNANASLLRASISQDATVFAIDVQIKQAEWRSVYTYQLPNSPTAVASASTRRFSLASFQSRTFSNIQVC